MTVVEAGSSRAPLPPAPPPPLPLAGCSAALRRWRSGAGGRGRAQRQSAPSSRRPVSRLGACDGASASGALVALLRPPLLLLLSAGLVLLVVARLAARQAGRGRRRGGLLAARREAEGAAAPAAVAAALLLLVPPPPKEPRRSRCHCDEEAGRAHAAAALLHWPAARGDEGAERSGRAPQPQQAYRNALLGPAGTVRPHFFFTLACFWAGMAAAHATALPDTVQAGSNNAQSTVSQKEDAWRVGKRQETNKRTCCCPRCAASIAAPLSLAG